MTYEKLTALIEEALVEHWNLSVQKYDDIYGYVLYTTGDLSSIFPVYNRETDLKRDKNDASYNYYRYVAVEWQNFDETNIFETTNKSIQKILESSNDDQWGQARDNILEVALTAIKNAENSGLFGERRDGKFIGICIADSDDKIMEASSIALNTPTTHALYMAETGCGESSELPVLDVSPLNSNGVLTDNLLVFDQNGISNLHRAAQNNDLTELEKLISAGVDVNVRINGDDWPPLISAITVGNLPAIKALIDAGADTNLASKNGASPLHFSKGAITKMLLEHGANVNARNNRGWTPLHSAALFGRVDAATLLLANGAELSAKTDVGETALEIAQEEGQAEVVGLLQNAG